MFPQAQCIETAAAIPVSAEDAPGLAAAVKRLKDRSSTEAHSDNYRKKPVVIQAWQITPELFEEFFAGKRLDLAGVTFHLDQTGQHVTIKTLEGSMRGELGDWIIRGVKGELYPCKPDVFAATYDSAAPAPTIEQEIQAKGLTAPRVTPQQIEAVIRGAYYFTAKQGAERAMRDRGEYAAGPFDDGERLGLLTICVLVLVNGFTVTGESACASPENFDADLGRKIARANAVAKIWPLEGYLLKQRLYLGQQFDQAEQLSRDLTDAARDDVHGG